MFNRVLYWFITLPVLGKTSCLGLGFVILACTFGTVASIPASRARVAAQATQTAVAQQAQATQVAVAEQAHATQSALDAIATRRAEAAAAEQAQSNAAATSTAAVQQATEAAAQAQHNATATSIAAVQQATESVVAAQTASAVAVSLAATTTSQAMQSATDTAVALMDMTQAAVSAAATVAAIPTPTPFPEVAYKEIERWEKDNRLWIAVRIQPGITQADLVRLAFRLRTNDPTARYHIFDDAAQIKQYKRWSLSSTGGGFPEAWEAAHYIAMINQMFDNGKLEWRLDPRRDIYQSTSVELETSIWGGKLGDGSITSEEATGWASLFMKQTKTYACCVTKVHVTAGNRPVITITLKGELASRPEQSRQMIATAAFVRFQGELGECPESVMFADTSGSPIGDGYTPTKCN